MNLYILLWDQNIVEKIAKDYLRFNVRKSLWNVQIARFGVIFFRASGGLERPQHPFPNIFRLAMLSKYILPHY